ncbi:MAG: hypothetical protein WA021_01365 [Minisyncoccia bacterium]
MKNPRPSRLFLAFGALLWIPILIGVASMILIGSTLALGAAIALGVAFVSVLISTVLRHIL